MGFVNEIQEIAGRHLAECKVNEPMKNHTTFQIGGPADVFVEANGEAVLFKIVSFCKENGVPFFILGKGSNLLVSDKGIRGAVLHLGTGFDKIAVEGDKLICQAGATVTQAANTALRHGLSGLEFAYGIPGSIGGGVYMNAGAYGSEFKDVFFSSRHLDETGEIGELSGEDAGFSYRHSPYSGRNCCILSATLQLFPGDSSSIREKMEDYLDRRVCKQPLDYPSAGSTFKRPEGFYAAALIEECGLKGCSVGGAMVSEKHSGFVVNMGDATAQDVLALTEHIKTTVLEKKGVSLQMEVKKIGF